MRSPQLLIGSGFIGLFVLIALLSLVWTPVSPVKMQILQRLKPPLTDGLLGTDQFGRDMAARLMAGAWNSLVVSASSVALGGLAGTTLGLLSAARGGMIEAVIMRINDVLFAIPPILSAMMLAALMGGGRMTAILAIAVFMVPVFARITAGSALQIWARDYVLAAKSIGKGRLAITIDHVLPNILGQIVVQLAIQLGLAILTEAGLGFLGLGAPPPTPSWGRMLADAQTYMATAPWLALLPGLAIALVVIGFNMLGDGLGALLDPKSGR
ncbi:ABC transporter permease [Allorhizobium sp. BGMRC 0089]|nr:ABC transporter permease [Allorhizobium sonneratiae]MCM2293276.1 ABC transporter permease [Allorhizobium sonneratiae]